MGCPVKKVIGTGSGSALLKDPARIAAILRRLRQVYSGLLTIKIRSGWSETTLNYREVGRIAEQEGVDAITLHPRTKTQGFSGRSCWEHITALKEEINIPVFGSGDVTTPEEALEMLRTTSCDGVMIGRGAYGNPWLFSQTLDLLQGRAVREPSAEERLEVALDHLQLHRQQFGDYKALLEMRKHFSWYARGLKEAGRFRAEMQRVRSLEEMRELAETFFRETQAA